MNGITFDGVVRPVLHFSGAGTAVVAFAALMLSKCL